MAESAETTVEPKKKNPLMMVLMIIIIILLLAVGFIGYAFVTKSFFFAPTDATTATEKELDETMFPLESFLVNLKSTNYSKRYIKMSIALGCVNKKDIKKLEEKQYQIRDIVITTIRSKDIEILSSTEEEEKVKEELVKNINTLFHPDLDFNVYYTEYIIQ